MQTAVQNTDWDNTFKNGVVSSQGMRALIANGHILSDADVTDKQIQPASMDLRLGGKAYRVRAGFLPTKATVMQRVEDLIMHEINLEDGGVLERGAVYIIPLLEAVNFPEVMSAMASPKSSTGRLDVLTRLITDYGTSFDKIPCGYKGQLYVEVTPLTFTIIARTGDTLNQMRLRVGDVVMSDSEIENLDSKAPLVYVDGKPEEPVLENGLWMSVDLSGKNGSDIIGYRALRNAPIVDLRKIAHYKIEEFWEPIYKNESGKVILNPEDFYIMASREHLRVPAEFSAEMMPYETTAGELRVHYAGFFDPGWGCEDNGDGGFGTTGVLEIRSHDVPFVLEHGQKICRMVYERVGEVPDKIYSSGIGSNYAGQNLKLAKQFIMKD